MTDPKAARLAWLLNKFGADLANDLEWALGWIARNAARLESDIPADRYTEARRHLDARRRYELACQDAREGQVDE
jgi:hypothetical protein